MEADKGSVGLKIDTLKEMHLETVLAADGDASAKIVIGDTSAHERQAERIATRIEAATGARLTGRPCRRGVGCKGTGSIRTLLPWEIWPTTPSSAGCITSGGQLKTFAIPAREGYALRTLHNLLGNGKNVVLLGAGDESRTGPRAASGLLARMSVTGSSVTASGVADGR